MRTILVVLCACGLVMAACSDPEEDPIGDKCAESCALSGSHPCAGKTYKDKPIQQACIDECKSRSVSVEKNPDFEDGCGLCVAASTTYTYKKDPPCDTNPKDTTCWCAPTFANPKVECAASCYEPDGGPAY